jgi:hypothetical protein
MEGLSPIFFTLLCYVQKQEGYSPSADINQLQVLTMETPAIPFKGYCRGF